MVIVLIFGFVCVQHNQFSIHYKSNHPFLEGGKLVEPGVDTGREYVELFNIHFISFQSYAWMGNFFIFLGGEGGGGVSYLPKKKLFCWDGTAAPSPHPTGLYTYVSNY